MRSKEHGISKFCINCGKEIPEKAKFCPYCGTLNDLQNNADQSEAVINAEPTPKNKLKKKKEEISPTYKILEPGRDFQGYSIVQLLNKDPEGFKYIAVKEGKEYLLKIFFPSSFSSVDNLYQQQMRLTRISYLRDIHTAKVVEVNLVSDPSYMVAEFIRGKSLQELREEMEQEERERFISKHIPALIDTAKAIRKSGLTINNLMMTGIMFDKDDRLIVLSSAIKYEEVDEREDIFTIGMIVAQFLAPNGLHRTIYSLERLKLHKFSYINGITISLNKLLTECLHRNILHRLVNLDSLLKAFAALPDIENDTIYQHKEKVKPVSIDPIPIAPAPSRYEWKFIFLVGAVIVAAALMIIWLWNSRLANLKPTPPYVPSDSGSIRTEVINNGFQRSDSIAVTGYSAVRQNAIRRQSNNDSRQNVNQPSVQSQPIAQNPRRSPIPSTFVHIESGTFGFGRLTQSNHNVSLSGFYISKYELTQAEWNRFMRPANVNVTGDNYPVENISWRQVVTYCNGRSDAEGLTRAYKITGSGTSEIITCDFSANGYRMPTEAEWEYAAKAGYLTDYSGSNDPDVVSWNRANSAGRIHEVGKKTPNAKGIYDMTGNVSEWVWDWYDADYIRNLDSFINPSGPGSGGQKVIRGGSIQNGEGRNLNILWREKGSPKSTFQFVGVRLVRSR